jgi:C_GCAxxG_C_C family probable redox protein
MNKESKASDTFTQGYSCSQAVLSARCERYGLDQKTALTIAAGFGGGMGRTGNSCGAVTGGIAIIGLHAGSDKAGDREAKENTYKMVRKFVSGFEEMFGSTNCTELMGCHIGTPTGYDNARKNGLFENVCPRFVDGAVEILDAVLENVEQRHPEENLPKISTIQ